MLKVNFNNLNVELVKGEYPNGRIAIAMYDPKHNERISDLTVNIPEAMFFGEMIGQENSYEALVNHIDGFDYSFILDWLKDNKLIELNVIVGEIQSGFNFYKGVEFKSDIVNEMRSITEI